MTSLPPALADLAARAASAVAFAHATDQQLFLGYLAVCAVTHVFAMAAAAVLPLEKAAHRVNLPNRVVSTQHASMVFLTAAEWWWTRPALTGAFGLVERAANLGQPAALPLDDTQHRVFVMMLAYLLYDVVAEVAMALWLRPVKVDWPVLGHHVFGAFVHYTVLSERDGVSAAYVMAVYLAELSTPFLNLTWVMKACNVHGHPSFNAFGGCLVLSFFVTRVVLPPYWLAHMYFYRAALPAGHPLWPRAAVMLFFCVLNQVWFVKIVKMGMKTSGEVKEAKKER